MNLPNASVAAASEFRAETGMFAGWVRRFGFRFLALYLALYNLPGLMAWIPGLTFLNWLTHNLWRAMVPWAGREVLRLEKPITIMPNGSGDTTFNYVQILCMFAVTLAGTCIWVWFDRKRRKDAIVSEAIRIVVRYSLGIAMVSYGIGKILHQQMPAPMLNQLVTTYGEFSPMGLLWRFMGYSAAYSFFAGICEFVGGLLLFFRRTATLGALLVAAVMFHVVLMNFCFDVPVKIYSTHLFLFAVFLAAPDLRRLFDLFILHRAIGATPFALIWPRGWMRYAALAVKVTFLAIIAYQIPLAQFQGWLKAPPKPELYGLYTVQEFKSDARVVAAADQPDYRWLRLMVTEYGVSVEMMTNRRVYYKGKSSLADEKLTLTSQDNPPKVLELTVTRSEADVLKIAGPWYGHEIEVKLHRVDFLLLNRGFHWVNEYPYNR